MRPGDPRRPEGRRGLRSARSPRAVAPLPDHRPGLRSGGGRRGRPAARRSPLVSRRAVPMPRPHRRRRRRAPRAPPPDRGDPLGRRSAARRPGRRRGSAAGAGGHRLHPLHLRIHRGAERRHAHPPQRAAFVAWVRSGSDPDLRRLLEPRALPLRPVHFRPLRVAGIGRQPPADLQRRGHARARPRPDDRGVADHRLVLGPPILASMLTSEASRRGASTSCASFSSPARRSRRRLCGGCGRAAAGRLVNLSVRPRPTSAPITRCPATFPTTGRRPFRSEGPASTSRPSSSTTRAGRRASARRACSGPGATT